MNWLLILLILGIDSALSPYDAFHSVSDLCTARTLREGRWRSLSRDDAGKEVLVLFGDEWTLNMRLGLLLGLMLLDLFVSEVFQHDEEYCAKFG